MPQIEMRYLGLIRSITTCRCETIDVSVGATLQEILAEVGERHGSRVQSLLLKDGREVADGILVALEDGERPGPDWKVTDSTTVTVILLSPMMAGG